MCKIEFEIPEAGFVTVKVVDIIGSPVTTLINTHKTPGKYIVDFNDKNLPPGRYYYKVFLHENQKQVNEAAGENSLITSGQVKIKV